MDKLELLLDMTEHPERYTEQQILALLNDEDVRKHYEVMVRLRKAYDVKKLKSEKYILPEESDTSHKVNSHFSFFTFHFSLYRIAAIFLAAAFLGGLSFAAYRALSHRQTPTAQVSAPSLQGRAGGEFSLIRFSGIRLDSILTVISAHYGKTVCFRDEESRAMKLITTWNPTDSLATFIDHLNMFDYLCLTLQDDTIFVEQTSEED